jgi:NADPH:quinone reductase
MKALELRAYDGAPGSLVLVDRALPRLRHGEVLVRVAASPINPSDLMFLRGLYARKDLPVIAGFEASGTVVAAGGGAYARALVGRRVACSAPPDGDGTWAEYVASPALGCVPLLPWVDLEAASALLVNPMTAWALLEIAAQGGHRALAQTAAAGQLGRMLARLAIRRRIPMIHVVRRQEQVDLLRSLGAEEVIDASEPDADTRLSHAFRRLGVTLAFDAVAGETTGLLLHALPRHGRVIVYGALSESACQVGPGELIFGDKQVEGFWLPRWLGKQGLREVARAGIAVQRNLGSDYRTEVSARFRLEDAEAALARYKAGMTQGKVLFTPGR